MKTILVTGCAGFIGSTLCKELLDSGNRVIGIDNFDPYYPRNIKQRNLDEILPNRNFTFHELDILNTAGLDEIFSKQAVDHVIHLAAKAGVRPSLEDPLSYEKVNSSGTVIVLEAARKAGIDHVILASSSSVYGNDFGMKALESAGTSHPISPYAASKKSAEVYAYFYHKNYGLHINVLRFFTAYGPAQRPDMAFQKFARSITSRSPINLYGGEKMGRDFTYIDDVVHGITNALNYKRGFEIINIGSGREVKVIDVIRLMGKEFGIEPIVNIIEQQAGDPDFTCADITKARELLGYEPNVAIEDGIRKFVEWYKKVN